MKRFFGVFDAMSSVNVEAYTTEFAASRVRWKKGFALQVPYSDPSKNVNHPYGQARAVRHFRLCQNILTS